jgi:membrane protease YdiL (CAAX protease family)
VVVRLVAGVYRSLFRRRRHRATIPTAVSGQRIRSLIRWNEGGEMSHLVQKQNRPRATALLMALAWVLVVVVGALVAQALVPSWSATARSLAVTVVLAVGVAGLLTRLRWWGQAGFNGRARWHDLRLLWLPATLVVIPIITGFTAVHPGVLAIFLVGETLTAFMEEAYFRGIMLPVLRPTGALPAVLFCSLLFGAAHLGNVFFRESVALVVAQAVGAFCFGVGYAALRLRTGTLWPLIVLHMLSNTFAALGALPAIPILVGQDVVLLVYGLVLLRTQRQIRRDPERGAARAGGDPTPGRDDPAAPTRR